MGNAVVMKLFSLLFVQTSGAWGVFIGVTEESAVMSGKMFICIGITIYFFIIKMLYDAIFSKEK